jgi:hypothetical protein
MSISIEQLQPIDRLLNLLSVRVLDAGIIIEREAKIQFETADDHAICHERWQKATVFNGIGIRLRPRHLQVFNRWVYIYVAQITPLPALQ